MTNIAEHLRQPEPFSPVLYRSCLFVLWLISLCWAALQGRSRRDLAASLGWVWHHLSSPTQRLRSIFMKADAETLQTFWGNESQTVPFCHNLGPVSHFKPSYHKRSTKDNSAEVYFPLGAEIREGRAGAVALAGQFGTRWYLRALPTSNILWFLFKGAIKSSKYHL